MDTIRPTSRDAILEAAFQTFSKRPGASLAEIADHAGVGRATLHRHFGSREALMAALAQTARDELNDAVDAAVENTVSHTDGLRRALAAIIPLAERQWFLAQEPVLQNPAIEAAYVADQAALCTAIEEAKAEGTFDPNVPTRWIAETYDSLIFAAWEMVRDDALTADQAADLAWRTLTRGLGTEGLAGKT